MDILEKNYSEILKIIQIYLDKVEEFGFSGTHPDLVDKIKELTKFVNVKDFNKISSKNSEEAFNKFFVIQKSIISLEEIFRILAENKPTYEKMGQTTKGSTITKEYLDDIYETLDKIEMLLNNQKHVFFNLNLKEQMGKIVIDDITSIEKFKKLRGFYEKYGVEIIDFYSYILSKLLENESFVPKIKEQIEELKTSTLFIKNLRIVESKNTIQKLVQRFRLVPDCELLTPANLLQKYFQVSDSSDQMEQNLEKIQKLIGKGFIIIYKICGNLEHRIDPILKGKYGPTEGVNLKYITQTRSIIPLKIDAKIAKANSNKITIIGGNKQEFYYILETLDGKNYRMMRMWEKGQNPGEIFIPMDRLGEFFGKTTPSKRLSNYNYILDNELMKLVKPPTYKEVEILRQSYWPVMRERITIRVRDFFNEKIREIILPELQNENKKEEMPEKKEEKEKKKKTLEKKEKTLEKREEVIELLKSEKTINKIIWNILQLLIEDISTKFKKTLSGDIEKHVMEEITVSCLGDLQSMQNRFKSELEENYKINEVEFNKILSTEKELFLVNSLLTVIGKILDGTLKTFIDTNTGVFVVVENKIQMLKDTLLRD
jgi:hypothetical protein